MEKKWGGSLSQKVSIKRHNYSYKSFSSFLSLSLLIVFLSYFAVINNPNNLSGNNLTATMVCSCTLLILHCSVVALPHIVFTAGPRCKEQPYFDLMKEEKQCCNHAMNALQASSEQCYTSLLLLFHWSELLIWPKHAVNKA